MGCPGAARSPVVKRLPGTQPFSVNGRNYQPPGRPLAVICLDGWADEYLDAALLRNRMPNLRRLASEGFRGMARGALPSFTNVNNVSIITGLPPARHGISGNYFLDPDSKAEVMMNSAQYLRADTILAAAARSGRQVAMVTAKEKLRDLLARDLPGIAFSSEKAAEARRATHGIDAVEKLVGQNAPPIYSPEASLFVLRAGAALLENGLADFLYLSLTDYVQHKHPPEAEPALDFCAGVDHELGRLLAAGALLGLTADHGMNAKQTAGGAPKVIYLESELEAKFGKSFQVILPITDPYVAHHGALGSFAMVYLHDPSLTSAVQEWLWQRPELTEVYPRALAVEKLELPADRIGDFVVLSGRDQVIGRSERYHDLKVLDGVLRSHGGRYEEMVPFLLSAPLREEYVRRAAGDVRNFDIFDFTLNGTSAP